jgi:hypothetical protein
VSVLVHPDEPRSVNNVKHVKVETPDGKTRWVPADQVHERVATDATEPKVDITKPPEPATPQTEPTVRVEGDVPKDTTFAAPDAPPVAKEAPKEAPKPARKLLPVERAYADAHEAHASQMDPMEMAAKHGLDGDIKKHGLMGLRDVLPPEKHAAFDAFMAEREAEGARIEAEQKAAYKKHGVSDELRAKHDKKMSDLSDGKFNTEHDAIIAARAAEKAAGVDTGKGVAPAGKKKGVTAKEIEGLDPRVVRHAQRLAKEKNRPAVDDKPAYVEPWQKRGYIDRAKELVRLEDERAAHNAKVDAELAAKNAGKAAGEGRVLRKGLSEEEQAAETKRLQDEADAKVREKNRVTQAANRAKASDAKEAKAKQVIEQVWGGDDEANTGVDTQAGRGVASAVELVVNRARDIAIAAKNAGVKLNSGRAKDPDSVGRATHSKSDPENNNRTPWVNHVRAAEKLYQYATALLKKAVDQKRQLTAAEKASLQEQVNEFLRSDHFMRAGSYEEAAADRVQRNNERTAKEKEAKRGKNEDGSDADPDFDTQAAKSNPFAQQDDMVDAIAKVNGDIDEPLTPNAMRSKGGAKPADGTQADDRPLKTKTLGELHPVKDSILQRVKNLFRGSGKLYFRPNTGGVFTYIGKRYAATVENWEAIQNGRRGTAKEVFNFLLKDRGAFQNELTEWASQNLEFSERYNYVARDLLNKVWSRLHSLADNIEVVFIDKEAAERMGIEGAYYRPPDERYAEGHNGVILLHSGSSLHTIAHEVVHAVTARMIDDYPHLRADIRTVMDAVEAKHGKALREQYGMTNEHEFMSEALTNPDFQSFLLSTPAPPKLLGVYGGIKTAWDAVVRAMGRALGIHNKGELTTLDMAMRLFETMTDFEPLERSIAKRRVDHAYNSGNVDPLFMKSRTLRQDEPKGWTRFKDGLSDAGLASRRLLDKVTTGTQLGNLSDHMFGPGTPARKLFERMARAATTRKQIVEGDAALVREQFDLRRKYEASGEWQKFEDFRIDQTNANVFADKGINDQPHVSKDSYASSWAQRAAHEKLSERYEALPDDLKALNGKLNEFYRGRQREMALGLVQNVLRAASEDGLGSDALAKRIVDNKLTDADREVIGNDALLTAIKNAKNIAALKGPYEPLMRRGDFVVHGRHEIETPTGATRRMNDAGEDSPTGSTFEFAGPDRVKNAKAFLKDLDLPAEASDHYFDPATGDTHIDVKQDDGTTKRVKLTRDETNAEHRIRVEVQDKHVQFFERASQARRASEELTRLGLKDVSDADIRRPNAAAVGANFMPTQLDRMANALEKRKGFQTLPKAAQNELLRHLREQGLMAMATTRAQTRRLPRNNVLGASHDLTVNLQEYSGSTAGYLAKLEHQPHIDKLIKEMEQYTDATPHKGNRDSDQLYRRQRLREIQDRVYSEAEPARETVFGRTVGRLLQMSYLDKLASPAFHIINSSEPWTVSLPVLAGRHGMKALGEMLNAYSSIGALRTVGSGIVDTGRAFRANELTDHAATIRERLLAEKDGTRLGKLIDSLVADGLISKDAGMELSKVIRPDANMLGRALDRGDLMARQLGSAIEAINRSVTAVAAYRLEYKKNGGNHAEAVKYATEAVHDTMGNYDGWNAAPIFNHPIGRIALQFRKYAQKTYYLLGKQAVAAFKGDKEAMKTFVGLMATHMLVAGSLGMPLEAIKLGMLAAGMAGLTDQKYSDLEQGVRRGAANVFGVHGGEVFTRGLPRWLGFDLSQRMGMDSLLLGNQDPKSMKQDDLYAYFAKTFAGAPASYVLDAVRGMQELKAGNVAEASRLIVPLKIYADSVQAAQLYTGGKKSASGRQTQEPITLGEAFTKMLGFQPGRLAESYEAQSAIRGDQQERKKTRDALIGGWVAATPADKQARLKRINDWNKTVPDNARIKFSDLTSAQQRRAQEDRSGRYDKGIRYNKTDADLKSVGNVYATQR